MPVARYSVRCCGTAMRPPQHRVRIVASQQSGSRRVEAHRERPQYDDRPRRHRSRARWPTLLDRRVRTASGALRRSACRRRRTISRRRPRRATRSSRAGRAATTRSTRRNARCCSGTRCAQRGNDWLAHEAAGKPPLLHNDWEMIADARTFERPCNYALRAHHPAAATSGRRRLRPFVIIDPRAGHGPGIGGFKEDSEVGVALRAGPPGLLRHLLPRPDAGTDAGRRRRRRGRVRPHRRRAPSRQPEARAGRQLPGRLGGDDACRVAPRHRGSVRDQRRADVLLVRQRRRKPDALPRRPRRRRMAGAVRQRPRRAASSTARTSSRNFEYLNPANTLWEKYYHLWSSIDTEPPRFLEFERWWGGFYLFNDAGDPLDRQQPVRRQQALGRRRAARPRALLRPEVDQVADHRLRVDGRQHHAAAAGVQLDRRPLLVDRGDQGQRPDDRRPAARGRRPPRHLRLGRGREEGARADRRAAEAHPAAAARAVRHGHQGAAAATAASSTT